MKREVIVDFVSRYITEANNVTFTVSELADDLNSCTLTDGWPEVSAEFVHSRLKKYSSFVHQECQGDKLGKYRLTEDHYKKIKEQNNDPLSYDWDREA